MSETTAIEWADKTWSPWEGCQKVGPGCDNCYAETRNQRFAAGANWGPGAPRRKTAVASWGKPFTWARAAKRTGARTRVFPSLCDPFDNAVDRQWRDEFFDLIHATPELDWLLLTKRIGNVPAMVPEWLRRLPPNVWLGATVVDQAEADRDIPKLLAVPAIVRFLSIEPMLGPIDLCLRRLSIDWVIAGGESGPNARPAHPDWIRSLRDQCASAGVPFLFKQWGEWAPDDAAVHSISAALRAEARGTTAGSGAAEHMYRFGKKAAGRLLDGVTHDGFPV